MSGSSACFHNLQFYEFLLLFESNFIIEAVETISARRRRSDRRNRVEIKEPVFQPIAQNGPPIIFQPIAHNRAVTMIGNGGQKGVVGLEGSCHCFVPPCRKDGQMGIQSSCATTIVSEEEDLDLSLHL